MLARTIALLFFVSGCSSALAEELPTFLIEPTMRATSVSSVTLAEGTRLGFRFTRIPKDTSVLLHKCGSPCNSAKLIKKWEPSKSAGKEYFVILKDPGIYYFWVMHASADGEVGPDIFLDSTASGSEEVFNLKSGGAITLRITTK